MKQLSALILAAAVATGPAWSQTTGSWTNSTDRVTDVREHTAVYDAARNRMIVFGGFDQFYYGGYTNEAWSLTLPPATPQWTPLGATACGPPPITRPLPRARTAMVADLNPSLAKDRFFIWGGAIPQLDSLSWVMDFQGTAPGSPAWCSVGTSGDPSPSPDTRGVLDTLRQRLIVVSPYEGVYALALTDFSTQWTKIYDGPLAPTYIGAFAFQAVYDAANDRIAIFGGWTDEVGNNCAQEYRYDEVYALSLASPTSWVQIGAAATADVASVAVSDGTAVYDPDARRILLYGGERCRRTDVGTEVKGDVWSLFLSPGSGVSQWTKMPMKGKLPAARYAHSAIWDPGNHQMVVFGGTATRTTDFSDTWFLKPDDVVPPAAVTTLFVDYASPTEAQIVWRAPGDDGDAGTATLYDVYYRPRNLTTCSSGGINALGEPDPLPAGNPQSMIIKRLLPCTWYCFSMWTEDENGNRSEVSNIAQARTVCPQH